jgi:6-phosphogluconate dehydrogenase
MIGLGRMGANMVRRLLRSSHECVVYDTNPAAVADLVKEGAVGAASLAELVSKLERPRAVWIMIPAAITDRIVDELSALLEADDTIIDGGNSYFRDDRRRSEALRPKGIHYLDCGTSGGVWGLERGYCMMIGGDKVAVTGSIRFSELWLRGRARSTRRPDARSSGARRKTATCIAGPPGRDTLSRWSTTASNTGSWRPLGKVSIFWPTPM